MSLALQKEAVNFPDLVSTVVIDEDLRPVIAEVEDVAEARARVTGD